MAALETNEDKVPSDRLAELEMVTDAVLAALPPRRRAPPPDALLALLCAEQCNGFGVWGRAGAARGRLVGFGVFPALCALNHACLPNCTVAQEPRPPARRALAARALAPVPRGAELCISYSGGPLLRGDPAARAAWLAATYHFDCACALCRLTADDPRAARARAREFDRRHRCAVPGCGGLRYPVPAAAPPAEAGVAETAADSPPAAEGGVGARRTVCGGCGQEHVAAGHDE